MHHLTHTAVKAPKPVTVSGLVLFGINLESVLNYTPGISVMKPPLTGILEAPVQGIRDRSSR